MVGRFEGCGGAFETVTESSAGTTGRVEPAGVDLFE